jgi:hypothetical protein
MFRNTAMPVTRTLFHHAALVNRMAQALGIDMSDALARGLVDGEDWRAAVLRCARCENTDDCLHWMAGQLETAEAPPDICHNAALFRALQGHATATARDGGAL